MFNLGRIKKIKYFKNKIINKKSFKYKFSYLIIFKETSMKKVSKLLLSLALVAILVAPMFANAQSSNTTTSGNLELWGGADNGLQGIGFTNSVNPQSTAVKVINILLSFLGIIAVVLVLWAGFMWMTAAGNDDKVSSAKKIMLSAVIGLLIILAAYGIVNWVLDSLNTVV
jgi:branched-subunit amino acid transport protein AzlD